MPEIHVVLFNRLSHISKLGYKKAPLNERGYSKVISVTGLV
ncbi:hypothetical protein THOE12_110033 [Vibrio rotiferianus]|nr:hypothetical protein THOE12_110033 [Vibrio rotiferianus]